MSSSGDPTAGSPTGPSGDPGGEEVRGHTGVTALKLQRLNSSHLQVAVLHHRARRHGNVSLKDAVDDAAAGVHGVLALKHTGGETGFFNITWR